MRVDGAYGPPDDDNHLQSIENPPGVFGIGKVALHFWRYWEDDSTHLADFTGARIEMRIRGVSWVANDATFNFWIQARQAADPNLFANWAYTAYDMTSLIEDGSWHELDFTLSSSTGDWTFAGGDGGTYDFETLATSLTRIHNVHLLAHYPDAGTRPTGSVEIDWIKITAPRLYNR